MTATEQFAAADEFMHEPTDHPQFNESMYFNFVDGAAGFATLIRMGNRANEGHAEVTVLLYLPGGRAAFHFERAAIQDNSAFDAGGLRFDVVEALSHLRVTYSGDVRLLERGTDLEDAKRVFTENPLEHLELRLDYFDAIPVYGLGADNSASSGIAGAEEAIATGHYQGPCKVEGTITLGGDAQQVSGLGFRDHSWGPRVWQSPQYWRWVSGLADERNGFVGWVSHIGDRRQLDRGMVLSDGEFAFVNEVELSSTYAEPPHYPETMDMTLHTSRSTHRVTGTMQAVVPLRNRREGSVARLAEAVCQYDFDGRTAYGISEYHDLMIDGRPVGMGEV